MLVRFESRLCPEILRLAAASFSQKKTGMKKTWGGDVAGQRRTQGVGTGAGIRVGGTFFVLIQGISNIFFLPGAYRPEGKAFLFDFVLS